MTEAADDPSVKGDEGREGKDQWATILPPTDNNPQTLIKTAQREGHPPLTPSVPLLPTPGTAPPLIPPSDSESPNTDEGTGPPSLSEISRPITGRPLVYKAINPLNVTGDDQSPGGSPVGGAGGRAYNGSNEISAFFDVLESCAHIFEYIGRIEMISYRAGMKLPKV
uniref:Uncharacterized protein n=1 Tax=Amphimedon queenslandica TaxID=400682 RepID=A0A1X7T8W4_AMPQE